MNFVRFCIFAISFTSSLFSQDFQETDSFAYYSSCEQSDCCFNGDIWKFPNYLYFGYTEGRGLGYRRGYGTVGLFSAPTLLANACIQPFFDAKAYGFNNGKGGASIGLGSRYIIPCNNIVLGINGYYDYRKYHHVNLNQVGIGVELLGPCWDLRINGYIPVGRRNFCKSDFFDYCGDFMAINQERISSWYGADAELGTWLSRQFSSCNWINFYAAVGPYYYTRNHERHFENEHHHNAFGGRIRLLARIFDYVDLSVNATYDRVWHARVQGQITINIPLDFGSFLFNQCNKCACTPSPCLLRQIAIQPVQRNGIIVADHECCWDWDWGRKKSKCAAREQHDCATMHSNPCENCSTSCSDPCANCSSCCSDPCAHCSTGSCSNCSGC